nr:ribosomal protein S10 [Guinardia delicatula]
MIINIDLKSKDYKVINKFIHIFSFFVYKYDKECNIKFFKRKTIKSLFSILKSPHVNKRAQEQFEFKYYNCRLTVSTLHYLKILLLLKVLNIKFSQNIRFKTTLSINTKTQLFNSSSNIFFKKIDSTYLFIKDFTGYKLF